MQKYIQKLLKHERIRYSAEVKRFLFENENNFSLGKGDYIEKMTAIENIKSFTTNIYDIGKDIYKRYMGGQKGIDYSKNAA